MRKNSVTALVLILLSVVSCGPWTRSNAESKNIHSVPELLAAVPSDAIAVICHDDCQSGMAFLDSNSVLHKLNLSKLKGERMSLSLCYNGTIVPTLAVKAGGNVSDCSSDYSSLIIDARRLGLFAEYFAPDSESGRCGIVTITPSEAQLAAVRRHITEHSSIMDAPSFSDALAKTGGSGKFIIFRNEGAERLASKQFLRGILPRRTATGFLHTVSQWTVLLPDSPRSFDIKTVQGGSDAFFANMFTDLPFGSSKLGDVLPDDTIFAISISTPLPQYRKSYEKYLDASVKLNTYRQRLASLKKAVGTDPLEWEKRNAISEVARVCMDSSTVVLMRPARSAAKKAPEENQLRGFSRALYGEAFALTDDSVCAVDRGWLVFGSAEGVDEFLRSTSEKRSLKPSRGSHLIIYTPTETISWDKRGIQLWISSQ